jgi:WD40 repeat protein
MPRQFFALWFLFVLPTLNAEDVVRPAMRILRDECIGCHKPGKAKGGFILNTREKMMKGSENGSVVIEGKGAESPMVKLLAKSGDPHMPPRKQLSEAQIKSVAAWINAGAAWDATVFDEPPPVQAVKLGAMPKSYQPVLAITLSPDDKFIALARANEVCIHDLSNPSRALDQVLKGHTEAVQSIAWSPDGQWIVTGGFRSLKVWDVTTWREVKSLSSSLIGNITALAFSPDNATLFASDGEPGVSGFIHRIAFAEGKILNTWKAHDDMIYSLRMSADGKQLASGAADKLARIWSTTDFKLLGTYEGHTNHVLAVAFNKDATQLATAGADKEVKVWDVKSREQDVTLGDKRIAFTALAWTPDGVTLIALNDKGGGSTYRELVKHNGEQRSDTAKEKKLESVSQVLNCATVTKDGKTIFGGAQDGFVYLWSDAGKSAGKIGPQ